MTDEQAAITDQTRALAAVARIGDVSRRNVSRIVITNLNAQWLGAADAAFWQVADTYLRARNNPNTRNGYALDYDLRSQPCPLQHAFDELQRRYR